MTAVAVEHARQQWEEGHRRLQSHSLDRALHLQLHAQVAAVVDELNRRVGQTFTLAELADAYQASDRWLHEVLGPARHLAIVQDAAFYLYARGAVDYAP
jgi:transcriptional regulator GlxA family with amidase domain